MTCSAILRRVVLTVATQTRPHVVLHEGLCGSCLCHIAMTAGTLDPRANMRRMLELHQGGWIEPVDPFPRNLAAGSSKLGNFFDLRIAGSDFGVTQHALGYGRNGRARTGIGTAVTIQALQSMLDVNFMRVGNRLFGAQLRRAIES